MPSTSSTSVKPMESSKETLLGMTRALEQRFGCDPINDLGTTLNSKFNVFPNRTPANDPKVKWVCMGVGGRMNDTQSLTSAVPVLGTNMALYNMIPFRAVPEAQDLTPTERSKYALREVITKNGVRYALYYAKLIDFSQNKVMYLRTDPATGTTTEYAINYAHLNPTPPVASSNGVISDISDNISVILPASVTITGQEVYEAVNLLYGGDARFAVVSEIGFISGSMEAVQAQDANGVSFTYNEAIFAQLVDAYNWIGIPFVSTVDSWTRTLQFSMRNLITSG